MMTTYILMNISRLGFGFTSFAQCSKRPIVLLLGFGCIGGPLYYSSTLCIFLFIVYNDYFFQYQFFFFKSQWVLNDTLAQKSFPWSFIKCGVCGQAFIFEDHIFSHMEHLHAFLLQIWWLNLSRCWPLSFQVLFKNRMMLL